VQSREQHPGNPGHLTGFGCEPRQERDQLQLADPFAQIMLAGGDSIPAAVPRQPRHRVLAFELGHDIAPRRMLPGQKYPDLHASSTNQRRRKRLPRPMSP
jgi:hypothetical protein